MKGMKDTRARQKRNEHTGERRRGSLVRVLLERPGGASDRREPVPKEGQQWQSKVSPLSEERDASADALTFTRRSELFFKENSKITTKQYDNDMSR